MVFYKLNISAVCALIMIAFTGCSSNIDSKDNQIYPPKSGYISVESGKLFYQRFGKGDPIIVVHGGPGLDQSYLLPQMLELAKDHEVIFYDQRGSGRSLDSSIDPKYVNIEQFVQDLESLRLKLGLEKITIIGHSWGGFLSMDYAIRYPKNISSLILVGSNPANYKGQKDFIDEFNKRTGPIKDKIAPLFNYEALIALNKEQINQIYRDLFSLYFTNHSNVEKLTLNMDKKSVIGGLNVYLLMLKTSYFTPDCNLIPDLRNLNVPTLIIHGNQDIVPVDSAKVIQKSISNSKIIYLDDCGHFPYIEKPNEFFSSIRYFLSHLE